MKKELLIFIALLILASCTSLDQPLPNTQEGFTVTKLPNDLTLTIKEMHTLPLVTIQFWIHSGSRNEPAGYNGIAHVFEHIWFKGTATQPVGSFHKKVESLGGELNAMTSYDWTMFYVTLPSEKFDEIFPSMIDLLLNPAFNETEIEKEKEVVTEEQRFGFNDPQRHADDQFGLLLIDEHPYKHPIIGYKPTIAASTKKEIVDFYKNWYVPNNMNIIIVGDVQPQKITADVKNALAQFLPKELPALSLPREKPITAPRYNSTMRDVGYSYAALGYVAPKADDPEKYAFIVLNIIFTGGDSSRLQNIVKTQKNLIVSGTSVYAPMNDMGIFETVATIEPEKKGTAIAEILLQLNRFKTELVSEEELARAKKLIQAERVKSQQEIFQIGFEIGQSWVNGNINDYSKFLENIEKVTKEDIQKVAKKYFTAYTLYEVKPKP